MALVGLKIDKSFNILNLLVCFGGFLLIFDYLILMPMPIAGKIML